MRSSRGFGWTRRDGVYVTDAMVCRVAASYTGSLWPRTMWRVRVRRMESDAYIRATYDGRRREPNRGQPMEWFSSAPAAAHTSPASVGRNFPRISRHNCRTFAVTVSHPIFRLLSLAGRTDPQAHRRTRNISRRPFLAPPCVPSSRPCDQPDRNSPSPLPSRPSEHSRLPRTPSLPPTPLRPPHHPARPARPMLPYQRPRCRCLRASGRRTLSERA